MAPDRAVEAAVDAALELPEKSVQALAGAVVKGLGAVHVLAGSGSPLMKVAGTAVLAALHAGVDARRMAGLLEGAAAAARAARRQERVDVVWTGPSTATQLDRLTAASLLEVIDGAQNDLLIIGYAVQKQAQVVAAVSSALERNVEVTTLLERPEDNPSFHGGSDPFAGLPVRRLRWLAGQRQPGGASLHAKVLIADRRVALIGSANITDWAFERNIECGVLIRGGHHPARLRDHVEDLLHDGVLTRS
ncbi:DISARM system phospholipase D-like protein DrmC [Kineococcus sp. NPDC059986]|uniref:DISARM system phospholipase D-like protein DrmC n=1 Tax=Kineococcus sp. NPDC059986 TaxID=3155538 RepID=UPI00345059F5